MITKHGMLIYANAYAKSLEFVLPIKPGTQTYANAYVKTSKSAPKIKPGMKTRANASAKMSRNAPATKIGAKMPANVSVNKPRKSVMRVRPGINLSANAIKKKNDRLSEYLQAYSIFSMIFGV